MHDFSEYARLYDPETAMADILRAASDPKARFKFDDKIINDEKI